MKKTPLEIAREALEVAEKFFTENGDYRGTSTHFKITTGLAALNTQEPDKTLNKMILFWEQEQVKIDIPVEGCTPVELLEKLGPVGRDMLLEVLSINYAAPLESAAGGGGFVGGPPPIREMKSGEFKCENRAAPLESETLKEAANQLQIICCRILADWTESQDVYGLRDAVDSLRKEFVWKS